MMSPNASRLCADRVMVPREIERRLLNFLVLMYAGSAMVWVNTRCATVDVPNLSSLGFILWTEQNRGRCSHLMAHS